MLSAASVERLREVVAATRLQDDKHAVAALLHSLLTTSGYECRADCEGASLPGDWAADDVWEASYVHRKSGAAVVLKILPMAHSVVANFLNVATGTVATLDIAVVDVVNKDALGSDADRLYSLGLVALAPRLQDALASLNLAATDEKTGEADAAAARREQEAREAAIRRRMEQEDNAQRGTNPLMVGGPRYGGVMPGRNPLSIGQDDLQPPGFGPVAPGGGMVVGPGHPLFAGRGPQAGVGPLGHRPPGHPPGARFDPIDPFGARGRANPDPDHFRMPDGGSDPFM